MKLPKNPTEAQILAVVGLIIKSIYTRGTVAVQTLDLDSQGRLTGIFLGDGVRFRYTINNGMLSYAPVNPKDLPSEDGISLSEDALEFARLKLAGNTKQEKKCNIGYPCGFTCISQNKVCNKALPHQAKNAAEWAKKQKEKESGEMEKPKAPLKKYDIGTLANFVRKRHLSDEPQELNQYALNAVPEVRDYLIDAGLIVMQDNKAFLMPGSQVPLPASMIKDYPNIAKVDKEAVKEARKKKSEKPTELPRLIGSEKQIAWAEKIRKDTLEDLRKQFDDTKERLAANLAKETPKPGVIERLRARVAKAEPFLKDIAYQDDAAWWIENRKFIYDDWYKDVMVD